KVADAEEAAALSREAALKLGVDPTQLWIEAQRLQQALGRSTAPRPASAPAAASTRAEDRALVRLLLQHGEARTSLLPLLEDSDLAGEGLRAIVGALRQRPEADGPSLMTDLGEGARSQLTALLVDDDGRDDADPHASIADFQRRLELGRRLRRIREVSRRIAEAPSGDVADQFRILDHEGRQAHAASLGPARTHPPGPPGPQGAETHE
ncbi:MAG TPA: hypothetical protein VLI67_07665, partial [Vicinamibacteria bacterium]|nr:hypothetical protein [Vicinamibacteria bacterium]